MNKQDIKFTRRFQESLHSQDSIDKQAEQEAIALQKQGRKHNHNNNRTRQADDYNTDKFNKLFKG